MLIWLIYFPCLSNFMFMTDDSERKLNGSTEIFRMQHVVYYEEGSGKPTSEEVRDSRKLLLDRIQFLIYGDISVKPDEKACVDFRTKDDKLVLIDDLSDGDSRKFKVTIEKDEFCAEDNVIIISDNDSSLETEMLAITNIVRDQIMRELIDTREGAIKDAPSVLEGNGS